MIRADHIRELNRILAVTADLAISAERPSEAAVIIACQQTVFSGGFHDHADNIDAAVRMGFVVKLRDGSLRITDAGESFLSLNPGRVYELQPAQTNLLDQFLFVDGPLSLASRSVLASAQSDMGQTTIGQAQVRLFEEEARECFNIMLVLGTFVWDQSIWRLRPDRVGHVIRSNERRLTEGDLKEILRAQAEFGRAAEVLVVEFERDRLCQLGANKEAALVRRISDVNVGAGYDLDSFDSESDTLMPDRFIEVKASSRNSLRFFWSRNEYLVATRLGERYFIYFLGNFRPELGIGGVNPRVIQDPVQALSVAPDITMEPQVYLVTERGAASGVLEAAALHD